MFFSLAISEVYSFASFFNFPKNSSYFGRKVNSMYPTTSGGNGGRFGASATKACSGVIGFGSEGNSISSVIMGVGFGNSSSSFFILRGLLTFSPPLNRSMMPPESTGQSGLSPVARNQNWRFIIVFFVSATVICYVHDVIAFVRGIVM